MPLPIIHLGVAKKLVGVCNITNKASFYLGAIAPDAVHMRENFRKEDKALSHLTNNDLKIWKKNASEFLFENLQGTNSDFYVGYGIHILTDIYWSETIYSQFKMRYAADQTPIQDEQRAYYNDTDNIDFELYKKLEYIPELWRYLLESKGIDVKEFVSSKEIDGWNMKLLHWYDSGESRHKNPIRYITYSEVLNFIEETAIKINASLCNYKMGSMQRSGD